MLPPFNDRGDLPPGIHKSTWATVEERFGEGPHRGRLMATLRHLHALADRTGHLRRFLVFGSFVTGKVQPGDIDIVLVMDEAFRMESAPRESQTLFSHADADARFGASVFWAREAMLLDRDMSAFLEFWQTRRDGHKRGIVEVVS